MTSTLKGCDVMTKRFWRGRARSFWTGAALMLCAVSVAGCWERLDSKLQSDVVTAYNALSKRSKDKAYPRDKRSVVGELQEGSAASRYQRAHAVVSRLTFDRDHAIEVIKLAADAEPGSAREPKAVSEACVAAGFPAQTDDPVSLKLNDEICVALKGAIPAFQSLYQGSRSADARSPYALWDPWAVKGDGKHYAPLEFMKLTELHRLHVHALGLKGRRGDQLEASLALLRVGQDLGRGGAALPALIGVAVMFKTLSQLIPLVTHGDLTEDELRTVVEGLNAVDHGRIRAGEVIRTQMLLETGEVFFLSPPSGLRPPIAVKSLYDDANPPQDWTNAAALKTLAHIDRAAERAAPTLEARVKAAAEGLAGLKLEGHELWVELKHRAHRDYDAVISVVNNQVRLLAWAAALRCHMLQHHKAPTSLAEVAQAHQGLKEDLLTGAPFVLSQAHGEVTLQSPALEGERYESLAISAEDAQRLKVTMSAPEGSP